MQNSNFEYELSVVSPFYNEKENLALLVDRIQNVFTKRKINGQIVLVNDCSTDNSGEIADEISKKLKNVKVVHHEINKGIAGGWLTGTENSNAKYICFIDSDLQYLPEEIWRLYSTIVTSKYDLVQGYRSPIGRLKDSRYIYSLTLNYLLNFMFKMKLRDNKSGFVIALSDTMKDILQRKKKYLHFQTFIAVSAHLKGYSIKEVETLFQNRFLGSSYIKKMPLKLIFNVFRDLLYAFSEYRWNRDKFDIHNYFISKNPIEDKSTKLPLWRRVGLNLYFKTSKLHKWIITSNSKHYYDFLKKSQWYPPEKIKELQLVKFQRLIRHAYNHVPYYYDLFKEHNITPDDIKSLADLKKIPMLGKDDVRENLYFSLFSDMHNKKELLKIKTSGSTGEPFVTYAERKQLEFRWATTLRAAEWTGWRFGDRQVRLWHQTLGMSFIQIIKEFIDAFFMRRLFIPAYELSDKNIDEFINKIKNYNPVLIDGYAESFNLLSLYLKDRNITGLNPTAIMTSAQVMTEQVRELIENQLKTKVFDKYGSREFSGIAYECDQHFGHHIMAESYLVEILKDGREAEPGEVGEVVITDLNNFSLPLIRYRIGDLAVAIDSNQVCKCGRGLPLIGRIEGRSQAIVFCKDGKWLPGTFFAHFFKDYDYAIKQYQIVQETIDRFDVKIIPNKLYSSDILLKIKNSLQQFVGVETEINFIEVDDIPLLATGKRTAIISKMKVDFQKIGDV